MAGKSLRWALPEEIIICNERWQIKTTNDGEADNGAHSYFNHSEGTREIEIGCAAEDRIIENLFHEIFETLMGLYFRVAWEKTYITYQNHFFFDHETYEEIMRSFVAVLRLNNLLGLKPKQK